MKPDERIEKAIHQQLSDEEWANFQEEVIKDETLRKAYVEAATLHGSLAASRDLLPSLLAEKQDLNPSKLKSLPWAIAAALVLSLIAVLAFRPEKNQEIVATLSEATNARWAGSELPTNKGAELSVGTLQLTEGMATLQFESGATVTMEAPATVEILSKMNCRLLEGSVVADVPESAHGFTIKTREMEVVDLGTRFGLTTSEFGHSHVYVFEGEVEVHRSKDEHPGEAQRLLTGNALHIGETTGPTGDEEIDRRSALDTEEGGWIPFPTFVGRGKDGYIRQDGSTDTKANEPLLMVKHTSLAPGNERRTVLTFDLADANLSEVIDAKLTLETESSGLGFSAMVPDSRFALYGVIDDGLDQWEETELLWQTRPEFSAPELSERSFKRLDEFEIKRGATPSTIEIDSRHLLDFLKSNKNELMSFVLVRETDELDKQGLVHAFASKEHPRSRPPTLWIRKNPTSAR